LQGIQSDPGCEAFKRPEKSIPVYSVADIIDTRIYRQGLLEFQFGLATSVGIFKGSYREKRHNHPPQGRQKMATGKICPILESSKPDGFTIRKPRGTYYRRFRMCITEYRETGHTFKEANDVLGKAGQI
jgi:hypothetical protein